MSNLAERLTKTERDQSHPNLKPRDAATLILVDRSGPAPKVLLGRRHAGLKFMAGKFVFPGGRMEPGDKKMPVASELDSNAGARLIASANAIYRDVEFIVSALLLPLFIFTLMEEALEGMVNSASYRYYY